MSDKIEVRQAPVQRNHLDVATELTLAYLAISPTTDTEEIQRVFLAFNAAAVVAQWNPKHYQDLLPEQLRKIASKH